MHIPRLVTLLALLSLSAPLAAHAGTDEEFSAFFESGYTYCDAELLSAIWKGSVSDAKARIGRKVSSGNTRVLEKHLKKARKKAKKRNELFCDLYSTAFTYEDAEVLASFWGVDVSDAKTRIGIKAAQGRSDAVMADLKVAWDNYAVPAGDMGLNTDGDELDAYFSSTYDYCDAKLLAALWGQDISDAKARIGRKVGWGDGDVITSYLDQARPIAREQGVTCEYWEAGYSYEDAEVLAAQWGISVIDAKTRIGEKIMYGNEGLVKSMLGR